MDLSFLDGFFGQDMAQPMRYIIAFAAVLVLILFVGWIIKRVFRGSFGGERRGRVARLAVLEAIAVDQRRRLVLIRRDNIEHLVLIGGPSDLVVEQGIQRVARSQAQRPAAGRPADLNFDAPGAATPAPPPRRQRQVQATPASQPVAPAQSATRDAPSQPAPRAQSGTTAADSSTVAGKPAGTPAPQQPQRPPQPGPGVRDDQLAGMAEKLEAALKLPVQGAKVSPPPQQQKPEAEKEAPEKPEPRQPALAEAAAGGASPASASAEAAPTASTPRASGGTQAPPAAPEPQPADESSGKEAGAQGGIFSRIKKRSAE